jgi:O-antigen ligase
VLIAIDAQRRRHVITAAALAVGFFCGAILPTTLNWKDERPLASTAAHLVDLSSGSGKFRLEHHAEMWRYAKEHPLVGAGPAGWRAAMLQAGGDPQLHLNPFPPSDYLRVLADGGVPALGALLIALVAAAVCAWHRRAEHPELAATLVALAIASATHFPLARLESMCLVMLLLAAIRR